MAGRLAYMKAIARTERNMATLQEIIDDFAFLDVWEDRYRYVIELG